MDEDCEEEEEEDGDGGDDSEGAAAGTGATSSSFPDANMSSPTTKPDISFATLCAKAILAGPNQCQTLKGIYAWVRATFPYYVCGFGYADLLLQPLLAPPWGAF